MTRKIFYVALGALLFALCRPVEAQQPKKVLQIGYLDNSTAAGSAELLEAFRKQMIQLGWIEGMNITVDYRFGEGKGSDLLFDLAGEMVRGKPDVILVAGTSEASAAKKATGNHSHSDGGR